MIRIEKLIPGGMALGTLPEGKKIFLWNALPGEMVAEYQITKNKSHYIEAIATKIQNPSPYRVESKDACYLSTSPWQIMDYDYELKQKQDLVVEIFREHGIEIEKPEILTDSKDYFYRNKMEYSLYWDHKTGKIFPAFHERGTHRKIPIQTSSIERPEIFAAAEQIIAGLNSRGEEARKYQSLLLRCNQNGEVSGGLYENQKPHPKFKNLTDEILGQTYSYSPNGFFQINLPVYELTLQEIKQHIDTDKVLDLYSGVGTIGLSVARDRRLTLVEVDKSAFAELKKNCAQALDDNIFRGRFGGYDREREEREPRNDGRERLRSEEDIISSATKPIFAKSEEVLDYIAPDQTVILDPPRAGCDKKLINKLNEIKPKMIIYLSCNPATQARDVKLLLENYRIKTIQTFNFFPHTPHIENLIILEQK